MKRVSESAAEELLGSLYGLDGTVRRLPGEHDDNFEVRTPDGPSRVLKIMAPERPVELVDLQCQALAHLEQHAPELALPRVLTTSTGDRVSETVDAAGATRLVWLLTYLPGRTLAEARPRGPALLHDLGGLLGALDAALAGFSHPAASRNFRWDLARAGWIGEHLEAISAPEARRLATRCLELYQNEVEPSWGQLPRQVIHGDANDYNILVGPRDHQGRRRLGLIDFGDLHLGARVAEIAVAAAYALLDQEDPLAVIAALARGYHAVLPLEPNEIAVLFPLVAMRLAVSVVNSSLEQVRKPDDPYVTISARPAWAALDRLAAIHPRFAHYTLRATCGLPAVSGQQEIETWLDRQRSKVFPLLGRRLESQPLARLDLSVASPMLGADPNNVETAELTRRIAAEMARQGAEVGVGRYNEPRMLYTSPAYASTAVPTAERRTVHLGVDLFVPAGTPLYAPLAGSVYHLAENNAPKDYGPLVILRHETDRGLPIFSLYGHLDPEVSARLSPGQRLEAGDLLGRTGAPPGNGDWPPHPHVQIILDLLELDDQFPGVAYSGQRQVWTALSPDPGPLLGVERGRFAAAAPSPEELLARRRQLLGGSLRLSYQQPLELVRGFGVWLYDACGRPYLDVYNNVAHVGHSHPRVVRAVTEQLGLLNTNTRYLHSQVLAYAERLTALLPAPLSVCYFLSSASEANELAVRLARAATGGRDFLVQDAAYHGHSSTLIELSPYKHQGPGGGGRPSWVHVAPLPDDYRGPFKRHDPEAGARYAAQAVDQIAAIRAGGGRLAAFLGESLPSVGGQIVPPPGYLGPIYHAVREAGGVAIADEVQTGFGRLGKVFWGFELQGVVPDIVVLGKPIGNGFPLAAVVTTPEIARAFDNGMEFFATFGGNPVAATAGLAVLDVLAEERLQENATVVGDRLLAGLRDLTRKHPIAGDARGLGFFLGLELVRNRTSLEPAPDVASYVVNRLRDRGILAGTDGPFHNVVKLRPPMVFNAEQADFLLATLDEVLSEDFVRDAPLRPAPGLGKGLGA